MDGEGETVEVVVETVEDETADVADATGATNNEEVRRATVARTVREVFLAIFGGLSTRLGIELEKTF